MNDVRLIVFDCDGTLVDSQHMIADAMEASFEATGMAAPAREDVRRVVGLSLLEAMAVLAPAADTDIHHRLIDGYRNAFADLRTQQIHEPLYDGIAELLPALTEAGYLLGIATGKGMRGLEKTLEIHDIGGHFITLQTADGHPSKPHPAMLEAAIAEAGATAAATVLVGDTSYDMMMARDAGAHPLGVGWGYHNEAELRQAGALEIAGQVRDIERLAAALLARPDNGESDA